MSRFLRAAFRRVALPASLSAIILFPTLTPAQDSDASSVQLGDAVVRIVVTERPPLGLTFLSVHENEQPAVTVARRVIEGHGGRVLELKAQRQRLVSFRLSGTRYTIDPNRIYTAGGIAKSLRRNGPYSRVAHEAVAQLAERLVENIRKNLKPPLVTVHNNTDGFLSVKSYLKGSSQAREAARVAINPTLDPDDFFLVTNSITFERLARAGFNVVLQSAQPTDDGSMSVFCQRSGIPYVNVEAEFGNSVEQYRMLNAIMIMARDHRP